MLVVLDTNVLLSAFLWYGKPFALIPPIESGRITPCFSKETLDEFERVLRRPKFKLRLKKVGLRVPLILKVIKDNGKLFELPRVKTSFVKEDPSDDKFLLLAQVARAKYLVTGDKHLLKLKAFDGIKILSISEFLKFI